MSLKYKKNASILVRGLTHLLYVYIIFVPVGYIASLNFVQSNYSVSYTHLTLPTILLV